MMIVSNSVQSQTVHQQRVYNFSPGPAALPTEVLERAHGEFLNWQGLGMSAMEISHRSKPFMAMIEQIEADLRELLAIPQHYQVLFLAGGASVQFAMLPLNLLGNKHSADYLDSGIWSEKALTEAKRYANVHVVASSAPSYTFIPDLASWQYSDDPAYLHITSNETVGGVQFHHYPQINHCPLVVDMSSDILSHPLAVEQFGVIYATAQKNIGSAGLTIVIIREDLLGRASSATPTVFNYQIQAKQHSLSNTPPTYSWYLIGLVFSWLKEQGGLIAMAEINQRKAQKLYACIDASSFYQNYVLPAYRSVMNVVFNLPSAELEQRFVQEANKVGLANLKGHSLVGGIRASIYNAMPEAGVDALVSFMQAFEQRYG